MPRSNGERKGKVGDRTMVEASEVAAPVPGRQSLVQLQRAAPTASEEPASLAPSEPSGPAPEMPSYASIRALFANKVPAKDGAVDVDTAAPEAKPLNAVTSDWRDAARAYNQRRGLVPQFNAATINACGAGSEADPDKVAAWQTAHGIPADGRIGPTTLGAAQKTETPGSTEAAPSAAPSKPAEPAGAAGAPIVPSAAAPSSPSAGTTPTTATAAPTPAATPAKAPGQHRAILQAEADRLLREFDAGRLDEGQAVQRFVAFDQQHGGGSMTPDGVEIMAALIGTMGTHEAERAKARPVGHSTSPSPSPTTSPATNATTAAPGEFTTASGNAIAKTTVKEAEVLNKLRREPRRFDPVWLATAQHNLGVVDATGAFNTETLRAMRARANKPTLDATGIMDETFLRSIATGTPFHEGAEVGTLAHRQAAAPGATSPKDRTAQDMGYASFAAYRESWGDEPVTFLGNSLRTPAHPYLRARLRVAETYLRNRVKATDGKTLDDAGIMKAINWNGAGNASYSHQPADPTTHQHAMGLALDIDPGQNPYLFDHSGANADFWVGLFERLFRYATKLYGGEPLTAATLLKWSQESSTEELFPRVKAASQSFAQLLTLSARAHGDESTTGEISRALAQVGYEGDALKTAAHEVAVADHHFHQQQGRAHAQAPTNLTQEMVIALRDVAGLAWGGTEMSSIENADFMHFDCRLTDFGNSVYQAGRRHRDGH